MTDASKPVSSVAAPLAQLFEKLHDPESNFLVTSPMSMINCHLRVNVQRCFSTNSETSAPNTASGTDQKIVKGWMKLSNCAASTT